MDITPEEALALINGYRSRPNEYITDVYGTHLWGMQQEIVESVFNNRETAVKTCNAVGKSYVAARIAHAFLDLHPGGIVVTTAPTWRQVKDILWREFAVCHTKAKYPLGGILTQTGYEIDKDWYAVGLSTKYPENFFGYHADHILVIVDEAGGVEEPIFKGVKAITPNVNARILYIGNPTSPSGTFAEAFNKPTVKQFTISAFDTPNMKHVGISNVEQLVQIMTPPAGVEQIDHKPFKDVVWPFAALISPEVVYERLLDWGQDSPMWQSLIMGEFPNQAENSLLPMHLVVQSMNISNGANNIDEATGKTYAELSGWNVQEGRYEYGLDMARFGNDLTVFAPKHGGYIDELVKWGKTDTTSSAQRVIRLIDPLVETDIKIDDTGNGGGTTDSLNYFKAESQKTGGPYRYVVSPYNFASAPVDGDKYHDITSELYWNFKLLLEAKKIALPKDDGLLAELTMRQWSMTPNGKIKVEDKESFKKRTGRKSPDKADAVVLACAPRRHGSWEKVEAVQPKSASASHTSGVMQTF